MKEGMANLHLAYDTAISREKNLLGSGRIKKKDKMDGSVCSGEIFSFAKNNKG